MGKEIDGCLGYGICHGFFLGKWLYIFKNLGTLPSRTFFLKMNDDDDDDEEEICRVKKRKLR